jgi:hypothetical protein
MKNYMLLESLIILSLIVEVNVCRDHHRIIEISAPGTVCLAWIALIGRTLFRSFSTDDMHSVMSFQGIKHWIRKPSSRMKVYFWINSVFFQGLKEISNPKWKPWGRRRVCSSGHCWMPYTWKLFVLWEWERW